MKCLGVITARRGSKGIPGKNTKLLGGLPLVQHSIEHAQAARAFDRLIVSTDDPVVARIAGECRCEVPFTRPPALCADDTPHLPVLQHAVEWLRDHDGYRPDAVMILQPTSPLRQPFHIRESIDLLVASGADSVVSVEEVAPHSHPMRAVRIDEQGEMTLFVTGQPIKRRARRRQELPQAWTINGAIYLFRTELLFDPDEPNVYGDRVAAYVMDRRYGANIDEPDDWERVERALSELRSVHTS
jgi:CMP-N-acetylneuraminic acid synthetase